MRVVVVAWSAGQTGAGQLAARQKMKSGGKRQIPPGGRRAGDGRGGKGRPQ